MNPTKPVLVADDEPNIRRVLEALVSKEGHAVLTAAVSTAWPSLLTSASSTRRMFGSSSATRTGFVGFMLRLSNPLDRETDRPQCHSHSLSASGPCLPVPSSRVGSHVGQDHDDRRTVASVARLRPVDHRLAQRQRDAET